MGFDNKIDESENKYWRVIVNYVSSKFIFNTYGQCEDTTK